MQREWGALALMALMALIGSSGGVNVRTTTDFWAALQEQNGPDYEEQGKPGPSTPLDNFRFLAVTTFGISHCTHACMPMHIYVHICMHPNESS